MSTSDVFAAGYTCVLQVEKSGAWIDIDGQTGASLNRSYETRDTTHKKAAGASGSPIKQEAITSQNFELTVEGNSRYADVGFLEVKAAIDSSATRSFRLIEAKSQNTYTGSKSGETAGADMFLVHTFTAYPSISQDFPQDDNASYSLSFLLTSEPKAREETLKGFANDGTSGSRDV